MVNLWATLLIVCLAAPIHLDGGKYSSSPCLCGRVIWPTYDALPINKQTRIDAVAGGATIIIARLVRRSGAGGGRATQAEGPAPRMVAWNHCLLSTIPLVPVWSVSPSSF